MFYVIAYVFLAGLAIAGKYWQLAFWVALVLSINFAALWIVYKIRAEKAEYKLNDYNPEARSPLAALVPDEPTEFPVPEKIIPGTYGTRRDYGYTDDTTHIHFKAIHHNDVKRIEAALGHISRMMACGRCCYVMGDDGFTMWLITRSGARGLTITYIGSGEAITRNACEIVCVVISPKQTETEQEQTA